MRLRTMSAISALGVALLLQLLVSAEGICNETNGQILNRTLPSLLPEGFNGVTILMEVSAGGETYVVKESYDKADDVYQLEYYDKENEAIYYLYLDRKNNVSLLYSDVNCKVLSKDVYKNHMPFMKHLYIHDLPSGEGDHSDFIGPALIFEIFLRNTSNLDRWAIDSCKTDRQMPCDQFCVKGDHFTQFDYYFSRQNYDLFNSTDGQPFRVTMRGANVEVLNIKRTDKSLDLFIPTGIMCPLPVPYDKLFPISESIELEAEVVVEARDLEQTYVSHFSLIYMPSFSHPQEGKPSLYSFSYSTWKITDSDNWTAENHFREIYDADHYLHYVHYDKPESAIFTTCKTLELNRKFKPMLSLTSIGDVGLDDLFLSRPDINDKKVKVAYLGRNKVNLAEAEVYEVTYDKYPTGHQLLTKFVVTHYLNGDIPLAITMNGFDEDGKLFTAHMHVSETRSGMVALNEKFRVDDCYAFDMDKSLSKWFQVGFDLVNKDDIVRLVEAPHQIKEEFLKTLYRKYDIQPMRVPHVSVDFVDAKVRVNTLLLEAPLIPGQFESTAKFDFKKPHRQLGVLTREQCLRSCLAVRAGECTAVSYCGSTCAISNETSPKAPTNTKVDLDCTIYERLDHQTSDHTGYPVSSALLYKIRKATETLDEDQMLKVDFKMHTSSGEVTVLLRADTFDDTKDFESAFHYDKGNVPAVETAFQIAESRKRYQHVENGPTKLGSFPMEDCATACRNRDDCESFSYCADSGECVISNTHDVDLKLTTNDAHCVIYQIKYLERFDKFDGLTIKGNGEHADARNAHSCAQKCIAKDGCKSFDFCGGASPDCVLYEKHIIDTSRTDVAEKPSCSHYSKRYLYDYSKQIRRSGGEGSVLEELDEINEADCAKRCSEWSAPNSTCLSFDFCEPDSESETAKMGLGRCRLRTVGGGGKTVDSTTCHFFYYTAQRPTTRTIHGAGAAFGLSVLMIIVGIGLGVGAAIGYSRFRG